MLTIMKASAGSGKTYNLAKKYISLLLKNKDRYGYRHILAVTFTNKATDEMKNRILKELHVLAVDPSRSKYLKDLVDELGFLLTYCLLRQMQCCMRYFMIIVHLQSAL